MAKIMIIDDDAQLLQMVDMMLERAGHTAVLVSDPEVGIERIKEEKPDLLILDVMMPRISGHELCQEIRATEEIADLPILILTARAQPIDRVTALESGADEYMSKPAETRELMEHINGLLAKAAQQAPREGLIVSMLGLRGGVGRTTLATNLAAILQRSSEKTVCLLDLSPAGGQVAMHLRLRARPTWADLPSVSQLDWPKVEENLLRHSSGLRVLAAPDRPQLPLAPAGELTTGLLTLLRENCAFTVIDLPALFNPAVEAALTLSDIVLHVVTPEVVAVQIATRSSAALNQSDITLKEQAYVLNQVTTEAQLSPDTVERGLKTRLAFTIGYDPNQMRALAQGMPLTLTSAKSPLPNTVRRMAAAIRQRAETDD